MALLDLAGRRWALRIIWELHLAGEPVTFRGLRSACDDVSSSVLAKRLAELSANLLVTHQGDGYALTDLGESLVTSMQPLFDWSRTWSRKVSRAKPPDAD
ncbi:winged helix-turn-helix transcriptional regulator [Aeromicrobium sp.]|uniref:winged helix-turn-helix transcriptional regulator n=1 Tax=Aeromicrobium sp. TaxID=1871063 RepID=UPI0030C59B09